MRIITHADINVEYDLRENANASVHPNLNRPIELKLLLKQRELIISSIADFTRALHNVAVGVIGAIAVAVGAVLSNVFSINFSTVCVAFQPVFFIILYIMYAYTVSNANRDYIRAIDQYVRERYGIRTLFYQGEMSFRHISRYGNKITYLSTGMGVAMCGALMMVLLYSVDFKLVMKTLESNLVYAMVVSCEVLFLICLVIAQARYNQTGKSKNYDDLYYYLSRGRYRAVSRSSKRKKKNQNRPTKDSNHRSTNSKTPAHPP